MHLAGTPLVVGVVVGPGFEVTGQGKGAPGGNSIGCGSCCGSRVETAESRTNLLDTNISVTPPDLLRTETALVAIAVLEREVALPAPRADPGTPGS